MSIKTFRKQITLTSLLALGACGANPSQPTQLDLQTQESAIVGGSDVAAGDAVGKSIVGLIVETSEGEAICTGSLLDTDLVVTAAHCMPDAGGKIVVVFGRNITSSKQDDVTVRKVVAYQANESYDANSETDTHDIALVRFEGGLPTGYAKAAVLPSASVLKAQTVVTLAGYGVSDGTTQEGSGVLRKVDTVIKNPAISKSEVELDQTKGKGACYGDSGGPAFVTTKNKLYLWGVTSRGEDGCKSSSIYTSILSYTSWIQATTTSLKAKQSTGSSQRFARNH